MFELKVKSKESLRRIVALLQKKGKRIVFTNGCFDLVHYGHAKYMEEAKAKGDCLIVAVNSDASVRKLKGPKRPVVAQQYRARLIAALESVDYVVIFGDQTPRRIIEFLKPDVLVKGADWKEKDIIGSDFVKKNGGAVYRIASVPGLSTTTLIKKIAKTYRP